MNNNFNPLISCSTCGRRNRKTNRCNDSNISLQCDIVDHKFWRPSPKLINKLNEYNKYKLQEDLQLYKTALEIICEREDDKTSPDECPPYNCYSECPSLNCKECCKKYALDEAKKRLNK